MIHVRKKMKGNALVESFGALIVRLPQGAKDLRILGGLAWWVPYPGWFPITGRVKSYEKITEDIEDNKASEPSEPSEPSLLVRLRCVGPCARQVLVAWQCDMCRHFENCHNLPVFFFVLRKDKLSEKILPSYILRGSLLFRLQQSPIH